MRFIPDSWLEALLRPFLMIDPVNGMYVELAAPDWRFAALLILRAGAWSRGRPRLPLASHQRWAIGGLVLAFALWTVVSGNGRYFIWGLLLAGPLVVVAARRLPASRFMRNTVIVGVLGLQFVAIALNFTPNAWTLRPWREGPGLALAATPLKERPAIFLTVGAISYSALVPQLHPQSRWSNITGQVEIRPGLREYPALAAMLHSDLPKYLVVRATTMIMGSDGQPLPKARLSIEGLMSRHGLKMAAPACGYVRTGDADRAFRRDPAHGVEDGFWFCPVTWSEPVPTADEKGPVAPQFDAVFEQVERRCPRMFPPGNTPSRPIAGAVKRSYVMTDMSLYVDNSGEVYFKNYRALNPTIVGTIDQVRSGQFKLDCERIPGRYAPPWRRE